jgi:carboxymethylenebutenolidase
MRQDPPQLSARQQAMAERWDAHTRAEFAEHSLDHTLATMTDRPFVNHVPVITGGTGLEAVKHFYGTYFIPCQPPDTEIVHVSRTIGESRVVDEIIHKFTHTIEMPWLLPGVPPTGKRVELAVIVVVEFEGDQIAGERIYWDQASVLAQVGLLDAQKLPVWGAEVARKVLDQNQPSNGLIERAGRRPVL